MVELKDILKNPTEENVLEIRRLYDRGIMGLEEVLDLVLYSNNANFMYQMALVMPELNMGRICNMLVKTKDYITMFLFARDVEGAHLGVLTRGIIKYGTPGYLYYMVRYVKEAPIKRLGLALARTDNTMIMCHFGRDFGERLKTEAPEVLDALARRILEIGSLQDIVWFSQIGGIPFWEFEKKILTTDKNMYMFGFYLYYFALRQQDRKLKNDSDDRQEDDIHIDKIFEVLLETRDYQSVERFIRDIKGIDYQEYISKLVLAIDESNKDIILNTLLNLALEDGDYRIDAIDAILGIGEEEPVNLLIANIKDNKLKMQIKYIREDGLDNVNAQIRARIQKIS